MKKGFFSIIILLACGFVFSGCIKNTPYITTTDPTMTATEGTYNFVAKSVKTSVENKQTDDSTTKLILHAASSDAAHPYDFIEITVTKYKGVTGVSSIVQSQASATYYHNGTLSQSLGGVVAITGFTSTTILGYFSFDTQDNLHITNGAFVANKP